MNPVEQKKAAKEFVERWTSKEGNEQREANSFWIELCHDVLGIASPTKHLDFERKVKGKRIDVFYEDMGILIENKSRGISLDAPEQRGKDKHGNPRMVTPYEQARWYADTIVPRSVMPKWIVTCNFDEIRIYNLDDEYAEDNYETLLLEELPEQFHRLSFFTRKENSRLEREKELSVKAGEVVGKLYDAFAKAYLDIENDEREQHSLNVLVTRIVFLLFAEDAGLLQERDAFYKYLKNFQVSHMRDALKDLFTVLKTPPEERDPYMAKDVLAFPYVNGGLFAADIIIPQFTEDTRFLLLQEASAEFDWKDISPTIFGAVFESTLNPETRRSGGMHYTSIENIHKLTGPLFYDDLKNELTAIEGAATEKERKFKLNAFRNKIASLKFLDPACGSGNFLTETYLSLRKLENRVLEDLYGGQMVMGMMDPIQVSIDQFYGIEINEFAVEVAKTALWIAELQMLDETRQVLSMWIDPLPLKTNDNIHEGNALRMDWNDVVSASECSYVIGNPPFIGHQWRTIEQQSDMDVTFDGWAKYGKLDYVCAWYKKFSDFADDRELSGAFVSTNSICQGESVPILWDQLFALGMRIIFAYQTFIWNSEAIDQAHVHCVIIGFSKNAQAPNRLTIFNGDIAYPAKNINGYLVDGPSISVQSRKGNLNPSAPSMSKGSQPTDGGNLILDKSEAEAFKARNPDVADLVKPFMGAREFLNGEPRFCLYLKGVPRDRFISNADVSSRLDAISRLRSQSPTKSVRDFADKPELFTQDRQPATSYLVMPKTTSGRRYYVPIGFMGPEIIVSDKLHIVPDADLYLFGLLESLMHQCWIRTVSGRLKSDYEYAPAVYNSFVWPNTTAEQHEEIERCAQAILNAREAHPDRTLAEMYDGISPMPENPSKTDHLKYALREYDDLKAAHAALDAAVETAYGVDFGGDEEKIVAHLFKLYAEMTEGRK